MLISVGVASFVYGLSGLDYRVNRLGRASVAVRGVESRVALAVGAGLCVAGLAGLGMRRSAAAQDHGGGPARSLDREEPPAAGGRRRGVAKGIASGFVKFAGFFVLMGLALGLYRRGVSAVIGWFEDPAVTVVAYRRGVSAVTGWFEDPAVVVGLLAGLVALAVTILGFEFVTWKRGAARNGRTGPRD